MLRLHAVVETPEFLTGAKHVLNESERVALIDFLAQNPMAGDLMQGTGGARKVRWAANGKGKSGGVRVIYYDASDLDQIRMLLIYKKGIKDDLSPKEKAILREINRRWA